MRGQQVAVIEVPEAAGFTPPRAQRGCQFGGRSSVARCGVWLLHYGSALDDVQPFPSLGRLRLMNCHGVAGVPSWSTHRFAPQMHSSMSSRHGKVPGVSLFSAASAGGLCWRRSSAQLTPSPVPAGLFPRGRRARKGRGSRGAGDGAVPGSEAGPRLVSGKVEPRGLSVCRDGRSILKRSTLLSVASPCRVAPRPDVQHGGGA